MAILKSASMILSIPNYPLFGLLYSFRKRYTEKGVVVQQAS